VTREKALYTPCKSWLQTNPRNAQAIVFCLEGGCWGRFGLYHSASALLLLYANEAKEGPSDWVFGLICPINTFLYVAVSRMLQREAWLQRKGEGGMSHTKYIFQSIPYSRSTP